MWSVDISLYHLRSIVGSLFPTVSDCRPSAHIKVLLIQPLAHLAFFLARLGYVLDDWLLPCEIVSRRGRDTFGESYSDRSSQPRSRPHRLFHSHQEQDETHPLDHADACSQARQRNAFCSRFRTELKSQRVSVPLCALRLPTRGASCFLVTGRRDLPAIDRSLTARACGGTRRSECRNDTETGRH